MGSRALEVKGTEPQTVALFSGGFSEFCGLDKKHHIEGDVYQFFKAPIILQLWLCHRAIDQRLSQDKRVLRALSNPVKVVSEAELLDEPSSLDQGSLLTSEITRGRLDWNNYSNQLQISLH
jgi:hypothetical protein